MKASALVADSAPLAWELHSSLVALDRPRNGAGLEALRVSLTTLRCRVEGALERVVQVQPLQDLADVLRRVYDILGDVPSPDLAWRHQRRAWLRLRSRMLKAYAALSQVLASWRVHVPSLRPSNYSRNIFHVGSACLAAATLGLFPEPLILVALVLPLAAWAWSMELLRRRNPRLNERLMAFFGPVAHPHEWHRVNSATWYVTALLVLACMNVPAASMVGLLVMGFGDPVAAIVGRRWGRIRLVNNRTLEGTLAFVASGSLAAWFLVGLAFPGLGLVELVAMVGLGAVVGALAELLSRRVDDNLSVPLAAAAAAAVGWLIMV